MGAIGSRLGHRTAHSRLELAGEAGRLKDGRRDMVAAVFLFAALVKVGMSYWHALHWVHTANFILNGLHH